jgi:drug/metabolite transporter (DMT)-like permease
VHTSTTARLALLALIWGSSFLWIKLALRGLSPAEVTFGRLILGAAVLFVIAAARPASCWWRRACSPWPSG